MLRSPHRFFLPAFFLANFSLSPFKLIASAICVFLMLSFKFLLKRLAPWFFESVLLTYLQFQD